MYILYSQYTDYLSYLKIFNYYKSILKISISFLNYFKIVGYSRDYSITYIT